MVVRAYYSWRPTPNATIEMCQETLLDRATTKFFLASVQVMPPTVKENAAPTATRDSVARPASSLSGDSSTKQQPIPLEIPVAVNGARGVDGSDKREPFSENTKTVLVFGSGAVIRLSSSVAPGQLLFLTNEKTKKEVVCQVVKSKNYRNVSGYVELEFTEPAVGFWGMRFPGDRLVSVPTAAPVAPAVSSPAAGSATVAPRPLVSKVDAPAAHVAPAPVAKPAAPTVVSRDTERKPSAAKSVVPAAPKVEAPVVQKPVVPSPSVASPAIASPKPEVSASAVPQAPIEPTFPIVDPSRGAEAKAFIIAPQPEAAPILSAFDSEVASPSHEAVSKDPEMEDLKQHTARLQEQLSSLHFADADSTSAARPAQQTYVAPVIAKKELPETAAKALGISKVDKLARTKAKSDDPVKVASPSEQSSLAEEELKIPSWLEPLVRNAAVPASTEEPIEPEKTQGPSEHAKAKEITPEPLAFEPQENTVELRTPNFGSSLAVDEDASINSTGSPSSGKGFLVGAIAAGVLLAAAGGAWYWRQQSADAHASAPSAQMSTVSFPSAGSQAPSQGNATMEALTAKRSMEGMTAKPSMEGMTAKPSMATGPSPQAKPPAQNPSPLASSTIAQSNPQANPASVIPASASTTSARTLQPSSSPAKSGSVTASAEPAPEPEQPKKPALGAVHLATPKVTQRRNAQNSLDADAGLGLNPLPETDADALNTGLVLDNKQPAAPTTPLPVGGDVRQAKLLSSLPPVYPALAKSQHVSGDVRIDALIDANGRVTTMKVVSGPTLLHQAAMDALRQWKYQPALLDGKPVAMHLTVTIQFHLQ